MASIRLERLAAYVSTTRNKRHNVNSENRYKAELGAPISGSYHVLYPVKFNDGVSWLLKVPANGTRNRFQDSDARALRSEALTMRLLRSETTIPLPDVFAFSDTCDNELNCPFILMDYIQGVSLYKVWFDRTSTEDLVRARRIRCLKDLAAAMAQLNRFSFNQGGSLVFDDRGCLEGVGPLRQVDRVAMLERYGDNDDSTVYLETGPFSHPEEYYTALLGCQCRPETSLDVGMLKLLRTLISWIPERDGENAFVLAHADYNFQNVLVSEDGALQAIIDWDGVGAVPRSVGCERLPSWLTCDWNSPMYSWKEDMERDTTPWGVWEDSPGTLKMYRSAYAGFIASHLSEGAQGSMNLTNNSLICESLLKAVNDPLCTVEVLENIFRGIVQHVASPSAKGFNFTNVCWALGKGRLSEYHWECLRLGFNALLKQSNGL
ncbi:kinase-like domain-containing protein [Aspergillus avenaceus]|uniref:Kinase-like domain-containing protein n=1 Tax=Aspergillus avenaceus TaxID=36643 RepID=A0A5N6TTR9_ASPAV|nr:kinase-like domain-containing protein [Aspergillus avenaceus]